MRGAGGTSSLKAMELHDIDRNWATPNVRVNNIKREMANVLQAGLRAFINAPLQR